MKRPNKLTLMGGGRLDTVGHVRLLPVAPYPLTIGRPGCVIGACVPSPECGQPLADRHCRIPRILQQFLLAISRPDGPCRGTICSGVADDRRPKPGGRRLPVAGGDTGRDRDTPNGEARAPEIEAACRPVSSGESGNIRTRSLMLR